MHVKHIYICAYVCVTYSLETDCSGDRIQDSVCMRKVREPSSLDALEVHGLKVERQITFAVTDKLSNTDMKTCRISLPCKSVSFFN